MRRFRTSAVALAISALSSTFVASTAAAPTASAADSFYTPPAQVPSAPGQLIKSQKIFSGLSLWGNTTRIMYSTRDDNNKPTAVTGAYVEPWAKWTGPGPRPVVAFSVGTIGQGDQCAPSSMLAVGLNLSVLGSIGVNYEGTAINNLLAKGVAVVLTDYVGLGTPDRPHTYMNRNDQAHAVLDAARVASKVPGSSVKADSKVGTYGYSQGGGAAGAAAEEASTYAPELKMGGSYVGAPPADLEKVLPGIDGSPIAGVAGYFINGAASEHPEVASFLDANASDKGKEMLKKVANQCIADTLISYGGHSTTEFTKSGEPLSTLMAREPKILSLVRAQRLGSQKPVAPVRVATGVADDVVPHGQARQLALDWCSKGANVTYAPISNSSTGKQSLLNHFGPMISDQTAARDWLVARLSGQPVTSNCSSVSSMK